jgi:hypothetical protein
MMSGRCSPRDSRCVAPTEAAERGHALVRRRRRGSAASRTFPGCVAQSSKHGGRKTSDTNPTLGRVSVAGVSSCKSVTRIVGNPATSERRSGSSRSRSECSGVGSLEGPLSRRGPGSNGDRRLACSSPPVGGASGSGASAHSENDEHIGIETEPKAMVGTNQVHPIEQSTTIRSSQNRSLFGDLGDGYPRRIGGPKEPGA